MLSALAAQVSKTEIQTWFALQDQVHNIDCLRKVPKLKKKLEYFQILSDNFSKFFVVSKWSETDFALKKSTHK